MGISLMDRQTPPLPMPRPERKEENGWEEKGRSVPPVHATRKSQKRTISFPHFRQVSSDLALTSDPSPEIGLSEEGQAASKMADTEYTAYLQADINKSPLYRLAYDIEKLRQRFFTPEETDRSADNPAASYTEPWRHKIPPRRRTDVVDIYPHSQPGNRDDVMPGYGMDSATEDAEYSFAAEDEDERDTMAHEFLHRAFIAVPEIAKAKKDLYGTRTSLGSEDDKDHLIIAILTAKYFPKLKEDAEIRTERNYGVDISPEGRKEAEEQGHVNMRLWQWADELEEVATQVLKDKGRHYEPEESSISEDIEAGLKAYHTWARALVGLE